MTQCKVKEYENWVLEKKDAIMVSKESQMIHLTQIHGAMDFYGLSMTINNV